MNSFGTMTYRLLVAAMALLPAGALRAQQPSTGEAWQLTQLPQSSLVYARDGSLIGEVGKEMRTSVAIRSLPKFVGQAFVAIEDQRFYHHKGIDEYVYSDHHRDAECHISSERIGRMLGDLNASDDDEGKDDKQECSADKSIFFSDHGINKISVRFRQVKIPLPRLSDANSK